MYYNEKHAKRVFERGDNYLYIFTYDVGEYTIDKGHYMQRATSMRVKCPYCNNEYDVNINAFFNRNYKCGRCCNEYENSFAYHIQIELGESLNEYWDWERNDVNPYLIYKGSNVRVWIKCNKTDYHDEHEVEICNFVKGYRCPYCSTRRGKVHPRDSFGSLYPDKAKYWSPRNKKTPFEVTPSSSVKYWHICQICGKEFEKNLNSMNKRDVGVRCVSCRPSPKRNSLGELKIKTFFDKCGVKIGYTQQKIFDDLIGVGGRFLSYDFYLPEYNLLIEYQGEFHDGIA